MVNPPPPPSPREIRRSPPSDNSVASADTGRNSRNEMSHVRGRGPRISANARISLPPQRSRGGVSPRGGKKKKEKSREEPPPPPPPSPRQKFRTDLFCLNESITEGEGGGSCMRARGWKGDFLKFQTYVRRLLRPACENITNLIRRLNEGSRREVDGNSTLCKFEGAEGPLPPAPLILLASESVLIRVETRNVIYFNVSN